MAFSSKSYTPKQALNLVAKLCAKQERSQQEIKKKLREYGLNTEEADEVLTELIIHGFVNEERFAKAYAWGKFNQLSWGKIKIEKGLKSHDIPKKLIQKALLEIPPTEYFERLELLLKKKTEQTTAKNHWKKKKRLLDYALQKGYEKNLIWIVINDLIKD